MYPTIKRHPDGQAFVNIDDAHAVAVRRLSAQRCDPIDSKYAKLEDKPGSTKYLGGGIWLRREPNGEATAWLEDLVNVSHESVKETCDYLKARDVERDGLPWRVQAVAEWLWNRIEAIAPEDAR